MQILIIRRTLLWRFLLLVCLLLHSSVAFVSRPSTTCSSTTHLFVANNNSVRPSSGVTSGLIATLAEQALRRRLQGQAYVKFDVTASSSDMLLQGRVGPVSVRGRTWKSPRGLTCRAIEAKVDVCELDMSKIVAQRKLLLTQPALGESFIAMNAHDFGNFLVHPLIRPPQVQQQVDSTTTTNGESVVIQFNSDHVTIDPVAKTVCFQGDFMNETWEFTLSRTNKQAVVTTKKSTTTTNDNDNNDNAMALSQAMTNFFNHLEVELDGTFLAYKDMSITDKGASPSLMLKLGITVYKFPAPGVPF
ncbi:Protein of unknown function (DUF2993) [Seminavis robusta]|uniref:Uncharacterized protein n=1 Tax=Seminavis robusta TaxID=568900 RepID=A0A9N8H6I4_9STRA|nr:Protein of unknown function (DUF2993) [Seminavis robusta]|eukprot:Sro113_g055910.1 Protein of unknown function (DUF2993) (303) ;mRNA; r:8513-9421